MANATENDGLRSDKEGGGACRPQALEKCFRPDRKVAHSLARGIEDSIGHGGVHADDADLADALDPQRVHPLILVDLTSGG